MASLFATPLICTALGILRWSICKWDVASVFFNLHIISKSPAEISTPIGAVSASLPCFSKTGPLCFYHSNCKIITSARANRASLGFESVSSDALHQRQQERDSHCVEQTSEQHKASGGDILTLHSQNDMFTVIFCPKPLPRPCRFVPAPLIKGSVVRCSRAGPLMLSIWEMFTRLPLRPSAGASTSLTLPPHAVLSRSICSVWASKPVRCRLDVRFSAYMLTLLCSSLCVYFFRTESYCYLSVLLVWHRG